MSISKETCRAVMWGLACGDALGKDTEFMSVERIKKIYGETGIRDLSQTAGLFTDDTQMAVAVAEGLLDAFEDSEFEEDEPDETREEMMKRPSFVLGWIAKRFVAWAFGPKNNRAPGSTCMAGCRALRNGVWWTESGVKNSKGCGGMMRAAPVGLVYDDADVIAEIAGAQSEITHGHPASTQAAQLTALCVWWLSSGLVDADHLWFNARLWLRAQERPDPKLVALIERVGDVLEINLKTGHGMAPECVMVRYENHLLALGESWQGDEAFASALYCFLLAHQRGEGYVETVRYGANTDGDSDSIACVAGAFAGAFWGLGGFKGVPQSWIDCVEDSAYLDGLATRLAELSL